MQWISSKKYVMDAVNFSLSVCILSVLGEILEYEIFQVKVGTLKMILILEDIQIFQKTRTTHANYLFEDVYPIVFSVINGWKKDHNLKLSIFLELRSLHIFGYCLQFWPCFWTITFEPWTQISCFWAFITMF